MLSTEDSKHIFDKVTRYCLFILNNAIYRRQQTHITLRYHSKHSFYTKYRSSLKTSKNNLDMCGKDKVV